MIFLSFNIFSTFFVLVFTVTLTMKAYFRSLALPLNRRPLRRQLQVLWLCNPEGTHLVRTIIYRN